MPLIGILVGRYVGLRLGTLAVYIGAIILIGLGMQTLRETLGRDHETPSLSFESIRGIFLAGLGISTNEIAMGFPLGALGLPIVAVLTAIAVQAFFVTAAGILLAVGSVWHWEEWPPGSRVSWPVRRSCCSAFTCS